MIKSILGGKSKNLFDISKVVQSARLKNNGNGTLTVSAYGVSAGILRDLCPNIKVGDTIKAYYTPISWTAPNPPRVISISNHILDRVANPSFVVTEADLNGKVYFYNNDYTERNLPGTTVIGNIFITNDTTVTAANYKDRYVPHELTSYKSIIKVSDVCQLVDKSKFPDTLTKNGITLTNNTDGSLTLNGTPETGSYSQFLCNINTVVGHKYALIGIEGGMDSSGSYHLYRLRIFNLNPSDFGNPNITTATSNICSMYIQVMPNVTVNNLNCKPQLFDLTEMFGAGNEPKTVAEFKAKFPNDYYPYSPNCFVTSFDERMPCKTKNLFDINANSEKGYYDEQGNFYPNNRFLCFTIDVISNNTYCISTSKLGSVKGIVSFWNNNIFVSSVNYGEQTAFAYTVPSGANKLKFVIEANQKYSNIQLEKGTTATDYVPYGYV